MKLWLRLVITAWGLALIVFAISSTLVTRNFQKRITELEERCDARCHYGDKKCREHCDKAGHCPFDN